MIDNKTLLLLAENADDGDYSRLELILQRNADVNQRIDSLQRTLLMFAAWHSLNLVAHLLKCGASPLTRDLEGDTALMYACRTDLAFVSDLDAVAIADALLKAGADHKARNAMGESPIDIVNKQQVDSAGCQGIRALLSSRAN